MNNKTLQEKPVDLESIKSPYQYALSTQEAYKLFHFGTLAMVDAEEQGIRVDVDKVKANMEEITKKIEKENKRLKKTRFYKDWKTAMGSEPNIDSPKQLQTFLYEIKGIKPFKYTESGKKEVKEKGSSTKGSTDEEALRQLNIPALEMMLRMRKLSKIRDTYLNRFLLEEMNGYIHPFFNLHTARTFRSSSSGPNFQNIPTRDDEAMQYTRSVLYPRPGHQIMEIDYGALEVAIAATYHKDPTMLSYLREGGDMHADVAQQIFMTDIDKSKPDDYFLRKATKNSFTFPQFYGDYFGNNAKDITKWMKLPQNRKWKYGQGIEFRGGNISDHFIDNGIKSLSDLTDHMEQIEYDFWNNRFPVYQQWKENWWSQYQKYGYVDMLTGFRCRGLMSKNDVINYPVQGSAFHCLMWSFIELNNTLKNQGWDSKLIGQIHDSILLDVYPDEVEELAPLIRKITCEDLPEAWKWIITPLDIEAEITPVDGSWAEKEEMKI